MRSTRFAVISLAATLLFAGAGQQAAAAVRTVTGDTTVGPQYLRPGDYTGDTPPFVTGVAYRAFDVVASESDWQYTFITSCDFNCVSFFYNGAFDPANPHENLVEADAHDGYNMTALMRDLEPGRHYTYVVTGYYDYDWGEFSTTTGGKGVVTMTLVPEPSAAAMLLGGLAGVGLLARRRQSRRAA
jgi:hypothetical protein